MKNIGFFLAFPPEISLKQQGMGRLLYFLLSSEKIQKSDIRLIIATPKHCQENLYHFLQEEGISLSNVEFLTTTRQPILYKFFKRKQPKPSLFIPGGGDPSIRWLTKAKSIAGRCLFWVMSLNTIAFIAVSIIFFPFLFSLLLLKYMVVGVKFIRRKAINMLDRKTFLGKSLRRIRNKIRVVLEQMIPVMDALEREQLVELINKRKDIKSWYIPTLFWPEIKNIRAKKIIAAPDMVPAEFFTLFPEFFTGKAYDNLLISLNAADHIICYSEHVKQQQLIKVAGMQENKISIVKHGHIDLSKYIDTEEQQNKNRFKALKILQNYQKQFLGNHPYLSNFDFSSMNYIFYSSQIRPHKNFLSLVKAYQILLRKRFVNVKLVTTGDFEHNSKVKDYILRNRLQYDILSFHNVSPEVLTALNHLAICAVNPTLFEGGFPFTFTEAYSVGTPSVMSKIPVVLEEIEDATMQDQMLFDPYNIEKMANKIEWGIKNRDVLYASQKPLYEKFEKRTWDIVAEEYLDKFEVA